MILSKNAVGNLINRYKAVLGKCRLLNTFGSLALAAALTLGSAGLAAAAPSDDPGYWTGVVSIDGDVTVNTFFPENTPGGNITAKSITLGGDASLTLQDGARLINGIPGSAGDAPERLAFTMTGGELTLGGDTYNGNGINASINAKSVNISGGTVNITGKNTAANWYQAAQIGGYRGLTISGGIVNMNSYSQLFGGGTVGAQFTGGTINMLGDSTANAVGNSAAHIMFGGSGDNLIAGTAAINVGSDSGAGYGVITTGAKVNMTGGSINVQKGELLLQPDVNNNTASADITYAGNATGAFNQTGGTVTIADAGTMTLNKGMTYTLGAGGTLTNDGTIQLNNGAHMSLKKGDLDVNGGKFVVNGDSTAGYSHLKFSSGNFSTAMTSGSLSINGGFVSAGDSVTLDASQFVVSAASAGQISFHNTESGNLYAEAMTITTTGTIDTVNQGVLTSDTLTIESTGTGGVAVSHAALNLTGKASTLTVTEDNAAAALTLDQGSSLLIGADPALYSGPKTATINAAVNVDAGLLMVGYSNGSVTDAAAATFTKDVTVGGTPLSTLDVTAGSTMTMGAGTTLDIQNATATVTGTLNVIAEGSALKTTATTGVLTVKSGGRLNATAGSLGIIGTASGNILEEFAVDGGGTLKVDDLGALDLNDIDTLKGNLMTGNGLFDVGNATITGIDPTGGTVAYAGVSALGNTTSDALRNATVTGVNGALSGGFAGAKLAPATTSLDVATSTTLQLTGANGGNIVSDSNDDAADVNVAGTGTLVLGDAGSNNSGTVGNVTFLAPTGSLQAVGNGSGNFTVGDITGSAGTITASGATLNADTISVASVAANNGSIVSQGDISADSMSVTNGGSVAAKTLTTSADVTVANGTLLTTGTGGATSSVAGDLTLTDSKAVLGDMDVTGTTDVTGGSIAANSLTLGDDSTFVDGAKVNVATLTGANGKTIAVGSDTDTKGGTTLTVGSLNLAGGSLFIDPSWNLASSNVAVGSFTGPGATDVEINGDVGVGMNSMAAIGTTNTGWLAGQVADVTNGAGLTQNGVDSALGIYSAQVLGDGFGITVDGTQTTTSGFTTNTDQLDFSGQSLLVVTAAAASAPAGAISSANITSNAIATIADGAKLRITDAKVGQHYTVLGDNIAANKGGGGITVATGWTGSNFSTDSRMINGSFDAATGVLSTALNSAANVYPKLDGELVKVLDNAYTADQVGPAHVDSDVKGVRFLSRATSDNFIGGNADLAAKTIESAARIAVAGAVPQMTMAANNAAGAAITQRTSIAQPDGNGMQSVSLNKADGVNKKGMALWIMPLYQSQNAWNMEAGNNYDLKWHGGLGGVALGGDYTFDNALRAGIAFNIGGGYAEGEGDLAKTTNSFNFWGLGAYAGWAVENFGLTADVNYTSTYNKVKQELPGAMQMRDLKSDITAYALSTGLRAEYKLNTQYVDIIPHLGVRYMYVNTNSYDVKSNGTVMHGDEMNQNIWTFPIGVTFSKQVETGSGWYVKPSLDLGVIPATGDIEAKSNIRFTGTGTKAELDTHTMDYMSYTGGLGLDFGNDNLSLGVNYNIQASEHSTSHGVFGTVRYEF